MPCVDEVVQIAMGLREAIIDGWLACAPPQLADDYIAQVARRR